jgi:hypothetical protein
MTTCAILADSYFERQRKYQQFILSALKRIEWGKGRPAEGFYALLSGSNASKCRSCVWCGLEAHELGA